MAVRPDHVTPMSGVVKSYSDIKGLGYIMHPEFSQDIFFSRDSLMQGFRTSEIAGMTVTFDAFRCADGKLQARNLWPMGPTPMLVPGGKGCIPNKGCPAFAAVTRPAIPPTNAPRRAWSPHAGSRAIAGLKPRSRSRGRSCSSDSSPSCSRSRSRSRSSHSGKKSSSSSGSVKKAKSKKAKKGSSSSENGSNSSSSSSSDRSRSRSRSHSGRSRKRSRSRSRRHSRGSAAMRAATTSKDSKEIDEAKMVALQKLTKLQSVEPREARMKEWRSLLRQWHPDKNPDKVEVATAVFQFLQKGKTLLALK